MIAAPGIPLYVHPAVDSTAWARATEHIAAGGFVVINVHNGPGGVNDAYYPQVVAAIPRDGRIGYVDIGYARRRLSAIDRDIRRWIRWYGVRGIMLDQVPSDPACRAAVARIVDRARVAGCAIVIANPGTDIGLGTAELFDVVCCFENTAQNYLDHPRPRPSGRMKIWHLVYGCDVADVPACAAMARQNGVDYLHISTGDLPNPWQGQTLGLPVGGGW